MYSVGNTAANEAGAAGANKRPYGVEQEAFGDTDYQGVEKRGGKAEFKVNRNATMRPSTPELLRQAMLSDFVPQSQADQSKYPR